MYNGFSPLVFNDGHNAHLLLSQEGVHQGDPLGTMLFSTALHPFLLDLQMGHPSIRVLAYLDNMFLIGPLNDVLLGLNDVESSLQEVGLTIATENVNYSAITLLVLCILIRQFGLYLLALTSWAPQLGNRSMLESCLDIARSGQGLCDQLVSLNDPQSGMLLLRFCHVTRLNHLARAVCPAQLRSGAMFHDRPIKEISTVGQLPSYGGQSMATGNSSDSQWWVLLVAPHLLEHSLLSPLLLKRNGLSLNVRKQFDWKLAFCISCKARREPTIELRWENNPVYERTWLSPPVSVLSCSS